MPENFMLDPDTVDRLDALSNVLELDTPSSSAFDVNKVYNEFCTIVDSQLEVKRINYNHKQKSLNKAWWNNSLRDLAKEVRRTLRAWEANKKDAQLKLDYLRKQKEFSKMDVDVRGSTKGIGIIDSYGNRKLIQASSGTS